VDKRDLEKEIESVRRRVNRTDETSSKIESYGVRSIIEMSSGLAVGLFLGYLLDNYFMTIPLFLIIFSILGVVAGFYNFYKDLVKDLDKKNKE
jgi:ATP synthase protein I